MTSVECEICTRETTESLAKCSLTVSLSRRNSALKMSSHWAATVPADSVHLSHLTKSVKGKKGEVILLCSVPFWLWGAPLSSSHQENVVFFFTKANNSPCLQVLWFDMVKSPFFFPLPLCLWSHKVRGSFTLSFSFPALSPPNLPKLHDRGPELHTIKAYNTHVNTHRDVDRCSYAFLIPVVPQSSLSCLHPLPPSERGPQWCPEDAWDHGGVNDTSFSSSFCLCLSSFSISPSSVSCSTIIRFHLHFMQFFSWSSLKSFACNLKPCSSLLAQPDPDTGVLQQERRIYQSADLSSC